MHDFHAAVKYGGFVPAMGGPSHEVIVLGESLSSGSPEKVHILDLGAGDGRNAFFLASKGYSVTAVDKSGSALERLERQARPFSRRLTVERGCVEDFRFTKVYDVILAHGLLHFLDRSTIEQLLANIQRCTRPGGVNIYTTSFGHSTGEINPDFQRAGHKNALQPQSLAQYYRTWTTISHESYHKWDSHPSLGCHSHPIQKLIFKRKGKPAIPLRSVAVSLDNSRTGAALLGCPAIGATRDEVTTALGAPDRTYSYTATGPQYGFREFSQTGYILELLFFGRLLVYIANGVVSGKSEFSSNFYQLRVPSNRYPK